VGRREAAGTRLLLESRIYEEILLEPLANMFVALDKQFLELPVEVLILGDAAQIDPVTNMPIPASRETLDGYDLTANYAARALGATMGLSKDMKQNNLMQLLQALSSPLGQSLMGQINAVNFFRGIFKEFDVPNINEIFQTNPMLNSMMMQASGGQGMNAIPSSGQVAAQGPSALPQMNGMAGMQGADIRSLLAPPSIQGVPTA